MEYGFRSEDREKSGRWSRPSQDWNQEGSHRWNTGGGFEDRRDINSNWTSSGWGTAGRSGIFNRGGPEQDYDANDQRYQRYGTHAGRGPKGYQRSDERIKEDICDCLTRDPHVDASDIEVNVNEGEVTLMGTVADRRQKRYAEDAIENVPGVREIHNRIRVQPSQVRDYQDAVPSPS